ncbi:hypothetical protein [Candidatus Poriferisodalis sp.]|uniref:hypothetical protein n=1 Tax=Candidatus Poriferisodalis sp. TaxID=3101277 RepID=UPI003AF72751
MRRISGLFLAIALIGAACGGSDPDPPPATEAAAPTTVATTEAAPPTTQAPPPTTQAPPPTTEAPVVTTTTAAPIVTTTTAAPVEEPAVEEAPATPAAVEGTLLEGSTPEGFENLQTASSTPRAETCPGIGTFGDVEPVAYSAAVWVRDLLTGPFLDVWIARFESPEAASEALSNYGDGLIECGEFTDVETGALGMFTLGEDPGLGDESFAVDYEGIVQGLPILRYATAVRIGDSIYSAGLAAIFVAPDPAIPLGALDLILGL